MMQMDNGMRLTLTEKPSMHTDKRGAHMRYSEVLVVNDVYMMS